MLLCFGILLLVFETPKLSKEYCIFVLCNLKYFIILTLEFTFASSHHMKKCICYFTSWGISHWPSYWPSSNLTIPTNQCLFMSHEEMHLFFYVIEKCMRKPPVGILLPSSHLAISTNQCPFMSHEEIHLPFHLMRKCMGSHLAFSDPKHEQLGVNDIWIHDCVGQ